MVRLAGTVTQFIVFPQFSARPARDLSSVFRGALLVHVFPLSLFLPFSPPLSVQAGSPFSGNHYCCLGSHPGRSPKFGFVLVISKIVWAVFSVPGSIRVVWSLCGLPRGKQYYFGHFCVWFSGPEWADHIRTDTRGFGFVASFHCSFLVCIYF
jgi:hypothetical protein